ncbi:DUF4062 domain-containing protein [bacterium]|nr:DUF4062 domain-containing protein [bacterium]
MKLAPLPLAIPCWLMQTNFIVSAQIYRPNDFPWGVVLSNPGGNSGNQAMAESWQKIFVFISSTFNDMHAERDYLIKRVFPDLRDWCEARRLRLIDIDLRWGVTEADASSRRALKVCLERINQCRPFFVCFLGQRHGWAPGEKGISQDTFDEFPDLRNEIHPAASITELEIRHAILRPFASRAAESSQPVRPEPAANAFFYLRQPDYLPKIAGPRQLLTIYTDEIGPDEETPDERAFRELCRTGLIRLRENEISQKAPYPPVPYAAQWNYQLTTPEIALPLICPYSEEENVHRWRKTWSRFARIEIPENAVEIPADQRSAAEVYNAGLTRGRLSQFRSVQPVRRKFDAGTELAEIVRHDLQLAILSRYPNREQLPQVSDLQREIDQHEEFISNSLEGFVERPDDFVELDDYLTDDSKEPLILTGASGMGKSTLIAKWVDRCRQKTEGVKDFSIHARFIGQSDHSSSYSSLLRFLLLEIADTTAKLPEEVPLDPKELRQHRHDLFRAIGIRGKTVLVMDALDQLETGLSDFTWLSSDLPQNIKLVLSIREDIPEGQELLRRLEGLCRIVRVKTFDYPDRELLVKSYLEQYLKNLDPNQMNALVDSPGAHNPLFLKIVLSELRVFGAFANLKEKIAQDFGNDPISAFDCVLQRLETDPAYSALSPMKAVPLLFALLAHSRHGLSIEELVSMFLRSLALPDNEDCRQEVADTLHLLFRQVRPFLARREGRYDYFYQSFRSAALKRYTDPAGEHPSKRFATEWHRIMADYFQTLPVWEKAPEGTNQGIACARKVSELVYHLWNAGAAEELETLLSDLDFMEAKASASLIYDLIEDYYSAAKLLSIRVRSLGPFLQSNGSILSRYPQLLFQQAANSPEGSTASEIALQRIKAGQERRSWFRLINRKQQTSSSVVTFTGHTASVYACSLSIDGSTLATAGWDGLRIWNAETAEQLVSDPIVSGKIGFCQFTEEGLWISYWSERDRYAKLQLLEQKTWRILSHLDLKDLPHQTIAISRKGKLLAAAVGNEIFLCRNDLGNLSFLMNLAGPSFDSAGRTRGLKDYFHELERAHVPHHKAAFSALAFSGNGSLLIGCQATGNVHVWETGTGQKILELPPAALDLRFCALSEDGSVYAVGRPDAVFYHELKTGKLLSIITGHSAPLEGCCFTADGSRTLTCSRDQTVSAWDLPQPKETVELPMPEKYREFTRWKGGFTATSVGAAHAACCCFSNNGAYVAIVRPGQGIGIYSSRDLELVRDVARFEPTDLGYHEESYPTAVTFSADDRILLAGESFGALALYDWANGSGDKFPDHHSYAVTDCAYSPDGQLVLSISEDRSFKLWNVRKNKLVLSSLAHEGIIYACAFSPDGNSFFTASADCTVKQWNLIGKEIGKFQHPVPIHAAALSNDGSLCAAGGSDGSFFVWDLKKKTIVERQRTYCEPVRSIGWKDRQHLVVIYEDGTVHVVSMEDGTLQAFFVCDMRVTACALSADRSQVLLGTKNREFLLRIEI